MREKGREMEEEEKRKRRKGRKENGRRERRRRMMRCGKEMDRNGKKRAGVERARARKKKVGCESRYNRGSQGVARFDFDVQLKVHFPLSRHFAVFEEYRWKTFARTAEVFQPRENFQTCNVAPWLGCAHLSCERARAWANGQEKESSNTR